MDNFIKIMALDEAVTQRIVFVSPRKEGGINTIYDPEKRRELHQVFIHNLLPLREENSWLFDSFASARSHAAKLFKEGWEMLLWDGKVNRKCGDGGGGCGDKDGGSCGSGGGCGSSKTEGAEASGGGCGSGGCSSCSIE